jgi:two-component system sensor histidine kinase/response regulator
LANVSHELRTPLNAILGLSELLLHIVSPPLIDEQYNNVESIHSSALALLSIINQILDFSRIDAGRIDLEYIPFNIQSLVKDQMKIINPIVTMHKQLNSLDIQVDIDSNLPEHVEGDPTRIGQVLLNLLSNSIKFTERGNIKVKITKVDTGICSTSVKEDSHDLNTILIRFAVIDTGIGISKEALQTLFQPFSQATSSTKKRFGGTGMNPIRKI